MRLAALLFPLAAALAPPHARASDMPALLRAHDWPAATARAAAAADPIAPLLVTWLRLLTRDAATDAEIDRFLTDHPDWPLRQSLAARYDEALAANRDDALVAAACAGRHPSHAPALLRCADALSQASADQAPLHTTADPAPFIRAAWLTAITDPVAEAAFMHRWGPLLTPDDQRARFDRLAWTAKPTPPGRSPAKPSASIPARANAPKPCSP